MSGLFGSTILDVATGLFFVFLLLSLICSTIQEIISTVLKWRAANLYQGIQNLLCNTDLAESLYSHQLIKALGNDGLEPFFIQWLARLFGQQEHVGRPSYIPSRTFALALFDRLAHTQEASPVETNLLYQRLTVEDVRQGAVTLAQKVDDTLIKKLGEKLRGETDEVKKRKAQLDFDGAVANRSLGIALMNLIDKSQDPEKVILGVQDAQNLVSRLSTANETEANDKQTLSRMLATCHTLVDVRRAVSSLPEGSVRQTFLSLLDKGQADLNAALESVENWFDDSMQRLSGAYKRNIQFWLFVISLVLTGVMGVDSVQIVRSLAADPTLRAATVAEATQRVNGLTVNSTPMTSTMSVLGTTVSTSIPITELTRLALPYGYGDAPQPTVDQPWWYSGAWWSWVVNKVLGLLITILAVQLGAPFWFGVLSKIVNLRHSGAAPSVST